MEFPFNVNKLFKKKVTKVQNDLVPEGCVDVGVVGKVHSENVVKIIDALGVASAESQNLYRPVTSAERLRKSDHLMYVMTDPERNNKNGSVVGFLKTGYKNLYLFDKVSRNHETKPLCVLDFYIHESMQRKGLGKQLFDYMLQDVNISPKYLAMDKPSDSFMRFVKKHYGLFKTIPQAINYVIYDDFFMKRPDGKLQYPSRVHGRVPLSEVRGPKKRSSAPAVTASPPAVLPPQPSSDNYGRFAAFKPPSTVGECFSYEHVDPSLAAAAAASAAAAAARAGPSMVPDDAGDGPATPGCPMEALPPPSPTGAGAQMPPGTPMSSQMSGGQVLMGPGGQVISGPPGSQMTGGVPGEMQPNMPMGNMQYPASDIQTMPGTPMQGNPMPGTPMQGSPMPCTPIQGVPGTPMQGMSMNGNPTQGMPMQGMPMNGNPTQGMPMQGMPMNGNPTQGMPMQGMPMQGMQMQGMQMQGAPMQGMPMQGMPMISPLVAAGDGIGQGPAANPVAVQEAAGMPVCKSGPRSYESMRKTHYSHTPLW